MQKYAHKDPYKIVIKDITIRMRKTNEAIKNETRRDKKLNWSNKD